MNIPIYIMYLLASMTTFRIMVLITCVEIRLARLALFLLNGWFLVNTLCSQFMRFRIMRFSIYAVLGNGPNSCFMLQYSHIMRFLVKIIVYKILLIFFLHLCDSCIMRFLLGNKKRINGELSVCRTWWCFLTVYTFISPNFGHFFPQILGKKVSLGDDFKIAM